MRERLLGYEMVAIEGGTQALRRTMDASVALVDDHLTTLSVPNVYGALMLKAAAHAVDRRDRRRHLQDAVTLLACVEDPFDERDRTPSGSDRRRLRDLREHLDGDEGAWLTLPSDLRRDARAALDILASA